MPIPGPRWLRHVARWDDGPVRYGIAGHGAVDIHGAAVSRLDSRGGAREVSVWGTEKGSCIRMGTQVARCRQASVRVNELDRGMPRLSAHEWSMGEGRREMPTPKQGNAKRAAA